MRNKHDPRSLGAFDREKTVQVWRRTTNFSHPSFTSSLAFDRKAWTSPSIAQSLPSETLFSGRLASNHLPFRGRFQGFAKDVT